MPQSTSIDFQALKRALVGSDEANPVNCGVALLEDGSATLLVDKRRRPKVLAQELVKSNSAAVKRFWGTAYMDQFPGTLCLVLNKAPSHLAMKLRQALRGSGYGKVEITVADEAEAEEG